MKQTDPHFKIRLSPSLKERIEVSASASQRTMTAEIISRLEASFRDIRGEARLEFAAERLERLIEIMERNDILVRYPELISSLNTRKRTRS